MLEIRKKVKEYKQEKENKKVWSKVRNSLMMNMKDGKKK